MKRCFTIYKAPIPPRLCQHRLYTSGLSTTSNSISSATTATSSTNSDSQSHKPRKWGNRALPLSPIMDPMRIEQRNRYKQTKLPPSKHAELTPFQKTLVNNPYARALATDVRSCKITTARLPSFFHIPFELMPHPEPPHALHVIPARLFAKLSPDVSGELANRGSSSYAQGRRSVLRYVKSAQRALSLVTQNQREKMTPGKRKGLVWREDMDELVLGLLQNAVVGSLRWGLQHPKAGLVLRCDVGANGVGDVDGVSCLLYSDTIKSHLKLEAQVDELVNDCHRFHDRVSKYEASERRHKGTSKELREKHPPALSLQYSHPQPRYPSAQYKDRIIPVYSLIDMLGEEKMGELLKDTAFEDARAIVVKEGRLTTNVQMALFRLQEYLA